MFARLLAWCGLVPMRRHDAAVLEAWRCAGEFNAERQAAAEDRDRFRASCEELAGYLYRAIQAGDRAVELAEAADLAVGHYQDTAADLDRTNRRIVTERDAARLKLAAAEGKLRRIRLAAGTN
jgi:hypothetical protein